MPLNIEHIRKIKNRFLIASSALIFTAGIIMYSYQYRVFLDEENRDTALTHHLIHNTHKLLVQELYKDLYMHSKMILDSQALIDAIDKKDRIKMQELASSPYRFLQEDNPYLKIMTFRCADGISLLRMHKPDMYGDMLEPSRKLIIHTNETKKVSSGFEIGKLQMTYRLVTPIFNKEKYLGSLELGVHPSYILHTLQTLGHPFEYGLLVKPEHTKAATQLQILGNKGDYFLLEASELFKNNLSRIHINSDDQKIIDGEHAYIIKSDFSLNDHQNKEVARFLIAFNIDTLTQQTQKLLYDTLLFILITTLLLILLLRVGFNYLIAKLTASQEALFELNHDLESRITQAIDQNRQQEQKMLHQSRLAQMGELLSMIAHQWRQPLASINAITSQLRVKCELKALDLSNEKDLDHLKEHLHKIEKSTLTLSQTISDFKDFYKPSLEKELLSLDKPLKRALSIVEPSFHSCSITLSTDYQSTRKHSMHLNEMTQVVLNLIQNAIDELVYHQVKEPQINLSTYDKDGFSYISLCDNGEGITTDIRDKIFEPYFSTKENKNGSGLGLYMSKMIIEGHHQGKIYFESTPSGSCFFIALKIEDPITEK